MCSGKDQSSVAPQEGSRNQLTPKVLILKHNFNPIVSIKMTQVIFKPICPKTEGSAPSHMGKKLRNTNHGDRSNKLKSTGTHSSVWYVLAWKTPLPFTFFHLFHLELGHSHVLGEACEWWHCKGITETSLLTGHTLGPH